MLRTPALSKDTRLYRLAGDTGSDLCCYNDCDASATCWIAGTGHAWTVQTAPPHPDNDERRQAFEFCTEHGRVVAQDRTARKPSRKARSGEQ
jgi:hypothetical protein